MEFVPLNKAGNTGEEGSRIGLYEAAAAAASLLEVSDDMERFYAQGLLKPADKNT